MQFDLIKVCETLGAGTATDTSTGVPPLAKGALPKPNLLSHFDFDPKPKPGACSTPLGSPVRKGNTAPKATPLPFTPRSVYAWFSPARPVHYTLYKPKWRNTWIRDVFCYRIPAPNGPNGPNGPNQNTSPIQIL